jgi:hypothetical protein
MIVDNEHEYDLAVERLKRLLDEVGANEEHPLYKLLDTLGAITHTYGRSTIQFRNATVQRCCNILWKSMDLPSPICQK